MSRSAYSALRLQVIKTVDENGLLDGVKKALLGFSGGVDSSVLFDVMLTLREKYGFALYAAHINHMIRGEESDRDEEFVRDTCEKQGVKLFVKRADVPLLARESSSSLETAAREARYAFFGQCAEENGIDAVITAHNADDNTETVLFNLVRGASVRGLAGIPYRRGNVIRPLRDCTREMITAYANERGLRFVTDSTNALDDCARNIIRLNVIPQLKRINPSLDSVVLSESKNFSSLADMIDNAASTESCALCDLPGYMIASALISKYGNIPREQLEKIVKCVSERSSAAFSLSGGRELILTDGVTKISSDDREEIKSIEYTALTQGNNNLAHGVCIFWGNAENFKQIYKNTTTIALSSANIKDAAVTARPRAEGDSIRVRGMKKSVKKEFINKKIPREYRDLIPVICVDGVPAAVPFVGVDDGFAAAKGKSETETERFEIGFPFEIKSF